LQEISLPGEETRLNSRKEFSWRSGGDLTGSGSTSKSYQTLVPPKVPMVPESIITIHLHHPSKSK
jgi:hypothetical protein